MIVHMLRLGEKQHCVEHCREAKSVMMRRGTRGTKRAVTLTGDERCSDGEQCSSRNHGGLATKSVAGPSADERSEGTGQEQARGEELQHVVVVPERRWCDGGGG